MSTPITITKVLGRSKQGMTKPFLCVAEFAEYYVKGAYAGKNSLCCEWVANRLVDLALPSAPLGVPMFQPRREMLWAYDYNLAFDPDFDRERFFGAHVFGGMLKQWPEGFRERMEPLLEAALDEVPAIFAELPLEWLHVDGDESLPVQLDMKRVVSVLKLPFTNPDTFWKLP